MFCLILMGDDGWFGLGLSWIAHHDGEKRRMNNFASSASESLSLDFLRESGYERPYLVGELSNGVSLEVFNGFRMHMVKVYVIRSLCMVPRECVARHSFSLGNFCEKNGAKLSGAAATVVAAMIFSPSLFYSVFSFLVSFSTARFPRRYNTQND
jgi:hypothetical protein